MEIPISSTIFHFNTEGAWNKMFLNLLELQWNTNVIKKKWLLLNCFTYLEKESRMVLCFIWKLKSLVRSSENNLGTALYVLFSPLLNNAWYITWLDNVCVRACVRVFKDRGIKLRDVAYTWLKQGSRCLIWSEHGGVAEHQHKGKMWSTCQ